MEHKTCISCQQSVELTTDNFRQKKYTKKSGIISIYWSSYCIGCQNNKTTEWHKNNKEQCRENEKRYRQNNIEKVNERKSTYKKKNKEKISEYNKNYRSSHKEVRRKQDKERRKNDIAFRLRKIINRSIQKAIVKNTSITKCLPYSFQNLKEHLEKQFEPWMTWGNHGSFKLSTWDDNNPVTWTWNIDHIIPQSTLPYSSVNDVNFQKCWALDNLRPYSAKKNIIDGASRIRHYQSKK